MKIVISPHCDDESLFCAWTLLREKPLVVIVYDGHVQAARGLGVRWDERRAETRAACAILGCSSIRYLGISDADPTVDVWEVRRAINGILDNHRGVSEIYAPAIEERGHVQHNLVGAAVEGQNVVRYLTYTDQGKSTNGREVPILSPDWIEKKLRALACYKSQFSLDKRMGCYPHFLRSQYEYYAE